jgi:hypothetical protein
MMSRIAAAKWPLMLVGCTILTALIVAALIALAVRLQATRT